MLTAKTYSASCQASRSPAAGSSDRLSFVRGLALIATLLFVTACHVIDDAQYQSQQLILASGLITNGDIQRSSRWVLPRDSRFYVARSNALAELGQEHSTVLTRTVSTALAASFVSVRTGLFPESMEFALLSARSAGANFVVYPKLLIWDDKLGTWGEILESLRYDSNSEIVAGFGLDKALVQLIILDVPSGAMVDLVQVQAGSGLLSLYADRPESVLLPTLEAYFSELALSAG